MDEHIKKDIYKDKIISYGEFISNNKKLSNKTYRKERQNAIYEFYKNLMSN